MTHAPPPEHTPLHVTCIYIYEVVGPHASQDKCGQMTCTYYDDSICAGLACAVDALMVGDEQVLQDMLSTDGSVFSVIKDATLAGVT